MGLFAIAWKPRRYICKLHVAAQNWQYGAMKMSSYDNEKSHTLYFGLLVAFSVNYMRNSQTTLSAVHKEKWIKTDLHFPFYSYLLAFFIWVLRSDFSCPKF